MVSGVNSPMKNLLSKEFKLFYEMVSSRGRRTKRKRGETHTKNQLRKTPRKGQGINETPNPKARKKWRKEQYRNI